MSDKNKALREWARGDADAGVEKLKELLEAGADPNAKDGDGFAALFHAMFVPPHNRDKEVMGRVRVLVEGGADPNQPGGANETPFFTACAEGHLDVVKYLRDQGADVTIPLESGFTALHFVADKTKERVRNFTVTRTVDGKQVVLKDPDAIREAIGHHPDDEFQAYCDIASFLIAEGIPVDATDGNEQSALFQAAGACCPEMVEILLDAGADPNRQDRWGCTALHYAVREGGTEVVELLLQREANPNLAEDYGFTPLHEAALNGNETIIESLLEHGADKTAELTKTYKAYEKGFTPADIARAKGHAVGLLE